MAEEPAPRYRPEGTDFVIQNGKSFFNRPLYGGNSGFRIETGDRPEYAFHFPGRAGNIRIGILSQDGTKGLWVSNAKSILARYRPGSMIHEIRDPLLDRGLLTLTAIPAAQGEGLALRAELSSGAPPLRLVWAFGGSDGNKGRRNGDLNAENEPLDRFFAFTAERSKGSRFELNADAFAFTGKAGALHARVSPSRLHLADAAKWSDPVALAKTSATNLPVVVGIHEMAPSRPFFLAMSRDSAPGLSPAQWFTEAEAKRRAIAGKVVIRTPDAHLNAAAAALNVAADAIWDVRSGSYMHGAIGWRVPLLGWRGPYAGDALGDHDRTRNHIEHYGKKQITTPPPASTPAADAKYNLARSLTALNTNGIFSGSFISFYDMNTVAIDAMFRHLRWTGDLEAARRFKPVLDLHLDWQKRLFRRPFPDESSPLYEAYACIWASDELMYSGGGATHSSAYQIMHRREAARLSKLLGDDPSPHDKEATAISNTLRKQLWIPKSGIFAEFRDLLGKQNLHPSPALWTFYHMLDSEVASPLEAWQMAKYVETSLPRIPIRAKGVSGDAFQFSTTNWHPYQWSTNNVALAESSHTALALWQAGRADLAMPLLKGAILESMFLGSCPGNVGMSTPSDVFSGERYRDFGDGAGILARSIVEGLFGIRPDLLNQQLTLSPRFPGSWNQASIQHPRIDYAFQREGTSETHQIHFRFAKPVETLLRVPALSERVEKVEIDGTKAQWKILPSTIDGPILEIRIPPVPKCTVRIMREGPAVASANLPAVAAIGELLTIDVSPATPLRIIDPQECLHDASIQGKRIIGKVTDTPASRSLFIEVKQGNMTWIEPASFEARPAIEILQAERSASDAITLKVRNNLSKPINGFVKIARSKLESGPIAIPAYGTTGDIKIPAHGWMPGTHEVIFQTPAQSFHGSITNWKLDPSKTKLALEPIDLTPFLNESITRIFRIDYLSPRSPYCSLALPKNGIGGWCHYDTKVEIDDTGLRKAAGVSGIYTSPLGVPFLTPGPGSVPNVHFVSQWDNFKREIEIPLTGQASHLYLLMAGSTNSMQSRIDNGEVIASYTDGTSKRLALHNPTTWWPIDRDYHINRFAFAIAAPAPPRLDLRTGRLRIMDSLEFSSRAQNIPGGAATILDLPLDPDRTLRSLTVRALANDVVIGLMAATLRRD